MAAKFAHSHAQANRTLGGIEATRHQGQDGQASGGEVKLANGRKHPPQRVALLSTIQTDSMIFRLQRRRLFAPWSTHSFAEHDAIAKNMTRTNVSASHVGI
jgi:hypothetical protein